MDSILIFRTKLINDRADYDGFEYSDIGLCLTDIDKDKLVKIALEFYRSSLSSSEINVELSLGEVLIKGFLDPIAPRMKIVEGFIQREPVLATVDAIKSSADHVKDMFDQFFKNLFQIVINDDNPNRDVLNQVFSILVDHLNQDHSKFDGNYLLYCNLKFLCDTVYKDNLAMKGLLNTLQSVYNGENLSLK